MGEPAKKISIFGAAKAKPAATAGKSDKQVVVISGLEQRLLEMQFLKSQIADLEAQLNGVTDEIKTIGKEKFVELYKSGRANPNSFYIQDGEGCVLVIPTDKYIGIKDEDTANQVTEALGEDAVTVNEKFYFNPDVLERNQKAIEAAIVGAKNISNEDKENLLVKEVKWSIAKGMIDKLYSFGADRIANVLDTIQPVIQLKNCGSKMEDGGELPADGDHIADVYADHEMLMAIGEHGSGYYAKGGSMKKKIMFGWF